MLIAFKRILVTCACVVAGPLVLAQIPSNFLRDYYAAYSARDVDQLIAFYAVDAQFTDPTFGVHYSDRHELLLNVGRQIRSWDKLDWHLERTVECGNTLVVRGAVDLAQGDRRGRVAFASIFTFREGLVVEHHDYFDAIGLSVALNLVPPRLAPLLQEKVRAAVARTLAAPASAPDVDPGPRPKD